MKICKELVKRTIAGDVILVPVGNASLDIKGLITLNETGERVWDLLPECDTEDDIVRVLFEEYDVEEDVLREDVHELCDRFRALGII